MSSGEKTEPPTSKKLRDARNRGQVAQSKEIPATALFVTLGTWMWINFDSTVVKLQEMIVMPAQYFTVPFDQAMWSVLFGVCLVMGQVLGPYLFIVIVVGIASNYLQIGPLLSFESIKP